MRKILLLGLLGILITFIITIGGAKGAIIPDYTSSNPDEDGYIHFNGAVYTRNAGSPALCADGTVGNEDRAYIQWPTASIPDNATILAVWFTISVTQSNAPGTWVFHQIEDKPSTAANAALYADIANGTAYWTGSIPNAATTSRTFTIGNSTVDAACVDLQALLASDWFAVGVRSGSPTNWSSFVTEEGATDPTLYVRYSYMGVTYTFTGKTEANADVEVDVSVLDSDGNASNFTIPAGDSLSFGFTERPAYVTWNVTSGYYRRIYMIADTGNITCTIPEGTFAVFTPVIRDFAFATNSGAYLTSNRTIGGVNTIIERVPLTNLINGVPIILTVNRVYTLAVDTPTVDFSFSFYSTTSVASPVLVLTPPSYTDVMQFNTRYIHANYTRPTYSSITLAYTDDLADTTLTVLNIYTRDWVLVATWNTTSDNFSHTFNGLTNSTDYIAEALINHAVYGNLTYRRVFSGEYVPPAAPDLSGLGTFGGIDMSQIMGGAIIIITAALFSAFNAAGGLIVTALVAAVMGPVFGWITIDPGVIVLCIAIALFYQWGRSRG